MKLGTERKTEIANALIRLFATRFDEELSQFRAEEITDFMASQIGPYQYNQAINDACAFMMAKLDDMDVELHQPEGAKV